MKQNEFCSESELEQELNILFDNDEVQICDWLDTPIPRLDGQSPRGMLTTKEKRTELFQVLQEMKFGDIA